MDIYYFVGSIVGGIIAILVLHLLWEFVLFKRVFDDPVTGKVASVVTAWITAGVIWGMNAPPWLPNPIWEGLMTYGIPAALVGMFAHRRGIYLRRKLDAADDELAETFR